MVLMVGLCLDPCLSNQQSTLRSLLFGFGTHLFKKQSAIERYDYQALTKNRWIPRNGRELNELACLFARYDWFGCYPA